jgi:hypothetical protein
MNGGAELTKINKFKILLAICCKCQKGFLHLIYQTTGAGRKTLQHIMATTVITPEINTAFNNVKKLLRERLQPGIIVKGEFISNTNQSNDYLAFVYFYNVPGLGKDAATHHTGIELSALNTPEACVELIITEMKQQGIMGILA